MKLDIYQVDAFTASVFEGNPAAVMPLEAWLDDHVLQAIALENNLSETAFIIRQRSGGLGYYQLRWFTPQIEVDLCGHATLASAHVIWTKLQDKTDRLTFATRSGDLIVTKGNSGQIEMDFPTTPPGPVVDMPALVSLLGVEPVEVLDGDCPMVVLASGEAVRSLDFRAADLADVVTDGQQAGLIVTGPGGRSGDCVSRFFAPYAGIDEDPVTGSIHTRIVPYWAKKLGKSDITAVQVSSRGGLLLCTDAGERVIIRGECADYMTGVVEISGFS